MKIQEISIRDFKALKNASFSPGLVNVFIGANGSGKSTLLESIGVLSAAMTDRVDANSLTRKGVRLSAPSLYKSAFQGERRQNTISFDLKWKEKDMLNPLSYSVHLNTPAEDNAWRYHSEVLLNGDNKVFGRSGHSKGGYDNYVSFLLSNTTVIPQPIRTAMDRFRNYAIYQPFTAALRGVIVDPQQANPIGLGGGRLAEALEEIIHEVDGDLVIGSDPQYLLDEILETIEWAESVAVAAPTKERVNSAIPVSRRVLEFKDRYLQDSVRFTAYDASEGALFVLFMFCLALHPKTPQVFSVDNFDQAMHPRLARAVMRTFSDIIVKQGKTVFLTTHNPLVLDGLDLSNDNIRLFALNRSIKDGSISIERIQIRDDLVLEKRPLSQLWTSGRIGGVPDLL